MVNKHAPYTLFDRSAAPFIKWIGGKQRLLSTLLECLPPQLDGMTYHEPFLGAGSLFAALQPDRAFLSDANPHLISMYVAVRDRPREVFQELIRIAHRHSELNYYAARARYNHGRSPILQAARFIYLNRACYRGVFRVNRNGAFNVPFGHESVVKLPSINMLTYWANALAHVDLSSRSFETTVQYVKSNDFVYLDPPYPALNGTSYFAHYTWDRFDTSRQRATADLANALDLRGCHVMISNADTPFIRGLYEDWRVKSIAVTRMVTDSRDVSLVTELIFTNY